MPFGATHCAHLDSQRFGCDDKLSLSPLTMLRCASIASRTISYCVRREAIVSFLHNVTKPCIRIPLQTGIVATLSTNNADSKRWSFISFSFRRLRCDRCHLWKIKILLRSLRSVFVCESGGEHSNMQTLTSTCGGKRSHKNRTENVKAELSPNL